MKSRHWGSLATLGVVGLATVGLLQACYDKSDPCGPGLELSSQGNACLCPEGEIATDTGCDCGENLVRNDEGQCVPCPDGEVPRGDSCECAPGTIRNDEGDCEAAAIGLPCTSDDECQAPYDFCYTNRGYCTARDCVDSSDCPGDYVCLDLPDGSGTSCRKPPSGEYEPCSGPNDCAGFDAGYCDSYFQLCYVENCSVKPNDCFEGSECCDLSVFGVPNPICIPAGYCTTN
jgi:hypothetical protein